MQLTTTALIKGSDTPFANRRRFRHFRRAFKLDAGDCSRRRSRQFLSTFRYWLGVTARSGNRQRRLEFGAAAFDFARPKSVLSPPDRNLFEWCERNRHAKLRSLRGLGAPRKMAPLISGAKSGRKSTFVDTY
jgi:hypothetical protein